jgi:hypothetical protein
MLVALTMIGMAGKAVKAKMSRICRIMCGKFGSWFLSNPIAFASKKRAREIASRAL